MRTLRFPCDETKKGTHRRRTIRRELGEPEIAPIWTEVVRLVLLRLILELNVILGRKLLRPKEVGEVDSPPGAVWVWQDWRILNHNRFAFDSVSSDDSTNGREGR